MILQWPAHLRQGNFSLAAWSPGVRRHPAAQPVRLRERATRRAHLTAAAVGARGAPRVAAPGAPSSWCGERLGGGRGTQAGDPRPVLQAAGTATARRGGHCRRARAPQLAAGRGDVGVPRSCGRPARNVAATGPRCCARLRALACERNCSHLCAREHGGGCRFRRCWRAHGCRTRRPSCCDVRARTRATRRAAPRGLRRCCHVGERARPALAAAGTRRCPHLPARVRLAARCVAARAVRHGARAGPDVRVLDAGPRLPPHHATPAARGALPRAAASEHELTLPSQTRRWHTTMTVRA